MCISTFKVLVFYCLRDISSLFLSSSYRPSAHNLFKIVKSYRLCISDWKVRKLSVKESFLNFPITVDGVCNMALQANLIDLPLLHSWYLHDP